MLGRSSYEESDDKRAVLIQGTERYSVWPNVKPGEQVSQRDIGRGKGVI